MDLARFQGAEPLGVVLDIAHDDALHLWLATPVVRVRFQNDLLVRLPFDELEGAGADRALPELRARCLDRPRARDVEDEHREVGEERSLRVLEGDAEGVCADRLYLRDDRLVVEATELRLPVLERLAGLDLVLVLCVIGLPPPLEVPDDGGGVERRTVVELHVVSELEGPHPAVPRHLPFLGQGGLDLGRRAPVPHEAVEDLAGDARRDPIGDDGRIELHRLALGAEHEGLGDRGAGHDVETDGDEEREP